MHEPLENDSPSAATPTFATVNQRQMPFSNLKRNRQSILSSIQPKSNFFVFFHIISLIFKIVLHASCNVLQFLQLVQKYNSVYFRFIACALSMKQFFHVYWLTVIVGLRMENQQFPF